MSDTPSPDPAGDPSRRRIILGAQVGLVLLLILVNVVLWQRSSGVSPATQGATPTTAATSAGTTLSIPTTSAGTAASGTTTSDSATSPAAGPLTLDPADIESMRRAGRVILVVDTSASMEPRMKAVTGALASLVGQAPDGLSMGLIALSPAGARVVVPPQALTGTQRDAVRGALTGLKAAGTGQRPLYDGLMLAYQHALTQASVQDQPLVVVVTDGGRVGGADHTTFTTFVSVENSRRATTARGFLVGLTPGADMAELTRAATATGGRATAATDESGLRAALVGAATSPTPSASGR